MKKLRKILAFLLVTSMAFSLLSGCGANEKNKIKAISVDGDTGGLELPIENNGETITFATIHTTQDIPTDGPMFRRIREATGLNIDFQIYSESAWGEKLNVLMASKTLPDVVGQLAMMTTGQLNDLGSQGAFANIMDYVDEMPNFKKLITDEENSWYLKSYGTADGKLYGFPRYDVSQPFTHCMIYRKDIFEKHGLEMWNSPEEAYQVMKKLKELYPDSTPMNNKYGNFFFYNMAEQWGLNNNSVYYNEAAGEWKFSNTDETYREMLEYFKKCYAEGLLDSEFLTSTLAAYTSKLSQADKGFIAFDVAGRCSVLNEQSTVEGFEMAVANPVGPAGARINQNFSTPAVAIAKNDHTEIAMKLVDFLYSPLGKEISSIGVEGETYKSLEDGSVEYLGFEEGKTLMLSDLTDKYGLFLQGITIAGDKRGFVFTDKDAKAAGVVGEKKYNPLDPVLQFTDEEQEEIAELLSELENPGYEMAFNYVIGNASDDKAWSDWKAKAEKLGSERLVEIYNTAQKRYDN